MFLTKNAELTIFSLFVDLHEVICTTSALDVERYHALCVLALDAGSLVFETAYDALQLEPLAVNFAQSYWCLWRNLRTWDPHRAR